MELIDRYVYAVTRRLPEKKTAIEQELRAIIEEMLAHRPQTPDSVENVLAELGNPEVLADNYRGKARCLIGPRLIDRYYMVLRIVLGAVLLGISIATAVGAFFGAEQDIGRTLLTYVASLMGGALQAFAWVTIAFVLAEHYAPQTGEVNGEKKWTVKDLPHIPQKKAIIPRSESIGALIFSTIFIIIFWMALPMIGLYFFSEEAGWTVIPVFNSAVIGTYRWLIIGTFLLGMAKEIAKLIAGKWSIRLAVLVAILTLTSMILAIIVFTNPVIWNPDFATEMSAYTGAEVSWIWTLVTHNLIILVILAHLIEIATALYKGFKYSR